MTFFKFVQISGTADRLSEDLPYAFTLLSSFDPDGLATIDYVDSGLTQNLRLLAIRCQASLICRTTTLPTSKTLAAGQMQSIEIM